MTSLRSIAWIRDSRTRTSDTGNEQRSRCAGFFSETWIATSRIDGESPQNAALRFSPSVQIAGKSRAASVTARKAAYAIQPPIWQPDVGKGAIICRSFWLHYDRVPKFTKWSQLGRSFTFVLVTRVLASVTWHLASTSRSPRRWRLSKQTQFWPRVD